MTSFKRQYDSYAGHTFLKCYAGDFNGDGKSDVLVHSGNPIETFRSNGVQLDIAFSAVGIVPGWWNFKRTINFIADFNGDGKDGRASFQWCATGQFRTSDCLPMTALADCSSLGLTTGTFQGEEARRMTCSTSATSRNGKNSLRSLTETTGPCPTLECCGRMVPTSRSSSVSMEIFLVGAGWRRMSKLFVGDYTGGGKAVFVIFNGDETWSMAYVGMFESHRKQLTNDGTLRWRHPWLGWGLARHDQLYTSETSTETENPICTFSTAKIGACLTWACSLQPEPD